ncbi:recombination protein NinG [Erwinia tracheiphila]|uniref:Recombination protein NinG n=1 Tax=Erwinia tracheiphila TaxID=65700 RepID=A0A345CT65_9GAMM|nr:recombination protein NinG [Erwinia tracheiphila]AXF76632.1 recombination protein NinG [Erwinia tracheiphila]UIA84697.1 recombination protein NinG [Erwinia tracheiphila]UIA93289.1 recombination protein NinG [Erwinia tracheiphila]
MAKGIKLPKPKKCPICDTEYIPRSSLQKVCHEYKCAITFNRRAEAEKLAKAERKSLRKRKADLRPLKHWEDMTQRVVNDYIRERDRASPCISCGTWETVQWEAGHFRSRGAASHLRYHEDNIAKQCHRCNVQLSGNQQQYRISLIAKIGLQRVLALESDNNPHRYTREELDALRALYRAKLRVLIKQREAA